MVEINKCFVITLALAIIELSNTNAESNIILNRVKCTDKHAESNNILHRVKHIHIHKVDHFTFPLQSDV